MTSATRARVHISVEKPLARGPFSSACSTCASCSSDSFGNRPARPAPASPLLPSARKIRCQRDAAAPKHPARPPHRPDACRGRTYPPQPSAGPAEPASPAAHAPERRYPTASYQQTLPHPNCPTPQHESRGATHCITETSLTRVWSSSAMESSLAFGGTSSVARHCNFARFRRGTT